MVLISVYICISEDGFIADKSGGVGWLPPMSSEAQAHYEAYFSSVDLVAMGANSYKKVLSFGMGWPYVGKPSAVFSKSLEVTEEAKEQGVTLTAETPTEFVERLKESNPSWKVWLMGGALLTKSFEEENLIDEVILFMVPKSIGEGIPLNLDLAKFDKGEESDVGDIKVTKYNRK